MIDSTLLLSLPYLAVSTFSANPLILSPIFNLLCVISAFFIFLLLLNVLTQPVYRMPIYPFRPWWYGLFNFSNNSCHHHPNHGHSFYHHRNEHFHSNTAARSNIHEHRSNIHEHRSNIHEHRSNIHVHR